MEKNNLWKYIANRTFFLVCSVTGFLALQILIQCILFFRGEAPFWQAVLFLYLP